MDKRLTTIIPYRALRSLEDLLLPRECVVCGRPLLVCERILCVGCLADLPLTYHWTMPHNPMADAFNAQVEAPAYVRASSLFCYSGGYEKITQALKYRRNFAAGRWAAGLLGRYMREALWQADVVCCVPLHWTRRWRRGYNQAAVIARRLAAELGAAFVPRLLRRTRRTRTQTRLDAQARASNVSGAFAVNPSVMPDPIGHPSILLVDDVFTTGSTLAACYRALRKTYGDGITIAVATLAYVE